MEAIQSMAVEVLTGLALAVISLLGAYAMYGINKLIAKAKVQTAQIANEQQRKLLEDALADVKTLATITVTATEQTTASALREAVKDGSTNRAELLALGTKAFNDIKAKVTPTAQQTITKNLGSFDDYLHNLIESTVLELKNSAGLAAIAGDTFTYGVPVEAADNAEAEFSAGQ